AAATVTLCAAGVLIAKGFARQSAAEGHANPALETVALPVPAEPMITSSPAESARIDGTSSAQVAASATPGKSHTLPQRVPSVRQVASAPHGAAVSSAPPTQAFAPAPASAPSSVVTSSKFPAPYVLE